MAKAKRFNWFSWVSIGLAILILIEVLYLTAIRFDSIVNAHPAYGITLIILGIGSIITLCASFFKKRHISQASASIDAQDKVVDPTPEQEETSSSADTFTPTEEAASKEMEATSTPEITETTETEETAKK